MNLAIGIHRFRGTPGAVYGPSMQDRGREHTSTEVEITEKSAARVADYIL